MQASSNTDQLCAPCNLTQDQQLQLSVQHIKTTLSALPKIKYRIPPQ